LYNRQIKLTAGGADSAEWTKTYTDAVGRAHKTVYPDAACRQSVYADNTGQLNREIDPDSVVTLCQYNPKGELEYTAVDIDRDDVVLWGQPLR